jgi:hypothetical protein
LAGTLPSTARLRLRISTIGCANIPAWDKNSRRGRHGICFLPIGSGDQLNRGQGA